MTLVRYLLSFPIPLFPLDPVWLGVAAVVSGIVLAALWAIEFFLKRRGRLPKR